MTLFDGADAAAITQKCRDTRPENGRGLTLTERYYL